VAATLGRIGDFRAKSDGIAQFHAVRMELEGDVMTARRTPRDGGREAGHGLECKLLASL
jgi:hypothetical protein